MFVRVVHSYTKQALGAWALRIRRVGREGRTCLARLNSQAGTGTGKHVFSLIR